MKNLSQITRSIGPAARSAWSWLGLLYAQPIPIGETLYLWRYAADRDDRLILRRNLRGFLCADANLIWRLSRRPGPHGEPLRGYHRLRWMPIIPHAPIEIGEQASPNDSEEVANRP